MNILFINLSLRPDSKRRQLPVGLAYVMTAARRAGYEFDLIDMDIDALSMAQLEEMLRSKQYTVYAMGCIVTGYRFVRQVSKLIRAINQDALIVAGNSVACSIPEILLETTEVDVAVMGEGDVTFVDLLAAISNNRTLQEVQGIMFRKDDNLVLTEQRPVINNLDEIGFPKWGLFDLEKYNQYGIINVNTFSSTTTLSYPLNAARGCPYRCSFCYHAFVGQPYRKYSEQAVIAEIRRLHDSYGCDFISFWDELTFPNIKSVQALVDRMNTLDFKIGWEATARGDLFGLEHVGLIREMAACGCESISYSLENASPEILSAMNKKMDVKQFVEQSKALWAGGVTPLTSVIFGYPQETRESIALTLKICEQCNIFPSVGFLLPLPGTPIYQWALDNGKITDEPEYLERIGDRQDFHINLTDMDDTELVETVEAGLRALSEKLGLKLDSVFKTTTYQKPQVSSA